MNLVEIVAAWAKTASHNEFEKEIAIERLLICNQCPNKKDGIVGLKVCGECNCPIEYSGMPVGKVYTKEPTCPLNKWER